MAKKSLANKMKLKPGARAAVINPLENYLGELQPPPGVEMSHKLDEKFEWVQIFVKSKAELDTIAPRAARALKPESLPWVSFLKGTSKIQTDLTRDKGWDILMRADLKWINLVSVNDTRSAFSMRPYKQGEKRQSFR